MGLLKRSQNTGNNPDKIDCGEFVLNTAGRIIEKEDNKVELTKNEYKKITNEAHRIRTNGPN